jgi:hypothetical protein
MKEGEEAHKAPTKACPLCDSTLANYRHSSPQVAWLPTLNSCKIKLDSYMQELARTGGGFLADESGKMVDQFFRVPGPGHRLVTLGQAGHWGVDHCVSWLLGLLALLPTNA